jgi:hypothetical protein
MTPETQNEFATPEQIERVLKDFILNDATVVAFLSNLGEIKQVSRGELAVVLGEVKNKELILNRIFNKSEFDIN